MDRDNEAGHDIRCACPGEPLFINGIFVGTVTGPVVRALARDGRIDCIEGVEIKETGLEKVRGLSMDEVKFKSGHIRKKAYAPLLCPVREGEGRMAVIDHLAFYSLDAIAPDTVCALTVGDDTTEVAGDVLARRGIRIIGITDGDKDGILGEAVRARGSVILRVKGTTDDEAGAALARAVGGRDTFQGFVGRIKSELERMRVTYEAYP